MFKTRLLFALSTIFFSITVLNAKPALRDLQTYTQPDGTQIQIRKAGNEFLHFTTTSDGTLLYLDRDGFYRLGALAADGAVISTGVSISDKNASAVAVSLADVDINKMKAKRHIRRAPQTGIGLFSSTYPTSGSPKGLVILVEFSDVKFNSRYDVDAKDYFNDMINGENFSQYGGTGSALKYFVDQSGGKFKPSFDVLGPVTLPNTQSYYGKNDRWGIDQHAEQMVTHAVEILDPDIDFSIYDTDGDGLIDNIFVFYAGQGEADFGSGDTVWPHSWDVRLGGENLKVDGVTVASYACSNEWREDDPDGLGTFVHEFSHVMGLPDLYNTEDPYVSYTPDHYSVMDYGPYNNESRTPPNYGAYEKNALGWYEPLMLTEPMSVSLEEIASGQFGLIPTEKTTEFFLFENRQQIGWDAYIPGHGMLVWHIDYNYNAFENNVVNNNEKHQYVQIVEANNIENFEFADGYPFPGTSNNTSFTASTTPALKSWSGRSIDLPVTDIREADGMIFFNVAGGDTPLVAPEPYVAESSVKEMLFMVEWKQVEGAVDYNISVFTTQSSQEGYESIGFDNSVLSDGWSASASDWYSTNSNYGDAAPSFKFSKNNQFLLSPSLDGDVSKIEFWAKGQSSDQTYLRIEGLVDGKWETIRLYTPIQNKSERIIIDSGIMEGVRQVRFTMVKNTGNIAIDDIRISYGGGSSVLENYNNVSTGGDTFFLADRLIPGVHQYFFTVTATDGTSYRTSAPVEVNLDDSQVETGIDDILNEASSPVFYNLQGIRIHNPLPGSVVIECRGNKTRKIIFYDCQ